MRKLLYRPFALAVVAAVCFATGWLGLALAVPPGYATAIWPPSGIALAAVLLGGYRMWPGVLAGSFLVNCTIGAGGAAAGGLPHSLALAAGIGAGFALQAVAGAWLVRRFGGFPNPLRTVRQVLGLLVLGGPAACVIGAATGVGLLTLDGRVPAVAAAFTGITWWGGDTIGVFVFTPAVLALLLPPRAEWRRRALVVVGTTLTTFGLVVGLVSYTRVLEGRDLRVQVADQGARLSETLTTAIGARLQAASALKAFLSQSNAITPAEFARFASLLRADVSGLAALEWIPRVEAGQRAAFEAAAGFPIVEVGPGGRRRAVTHAEYFPVAAIDPPAGNEPARGLNLTSAPDRGAILQAAEATGLAVTGRLALVQGGDGVLAVTPVRRGTASVPAGFGLAVIRLASLAAAMSDADRAQVRYWLTDETDPAAPALLFANAAMPPAPFRLSERGLFGHSGNLEFRRTIPVGGRRWVFHMAPTQAFVARHRLYDSWFVLLGGLAATGMMGAFALIVSGREGMLRAQVDERTTTLREALARLGTVNRQLEAILASASEVAIIATGRDGVISLFNSGAERMLGYPAAEMAGRHTPARFHLDDEIEARARELSAELGRPVAGLRVFAEIPERDGREVREWTLRRGDGRLLTVSLAVTPVRDEAGQASGYLGIAQDITDRKAAETALAASEEHLRATFQQAGIGLISTAFDGRLMDVNRQFCIIIGYEPHELAALDWQSITHPDDVSASQAAVARMLADKADSASWEKRYIRKDGGQVWVRLTASLLADSQGNPLHFITAVEDIDQQKAAEAELQAVTARLHLVLDTVAEGILGFDAGMTVSCANRAAAAALGRQTAADLLGQPCAAALSRRRADGSPVAEADCAIRATLADGRIRRVADEYFINGDGGAALPVEYVVSPLEMEGVRTGAVVAFHDIGERQQREVAATRSLAEALVLRNILRLSQEDISLERMLDGALAEILSVPWLTLLRRGCVFLMEDQTLVMVAQRNLAPAVETAGGRLAPGQCLCGKAAAGRKVVFAAHVEADHRPVGEDDHGHYCIPIGDEAGALGVLNTYVPAGHRPDEADERFLVTVADTLAGIIRRKRVEAALRYSEDVSRTLLNATADAAFLIDRDGMLLAVNDALAARFGCRSTDLMGTCLFDRLPPELAGKRRGDIAWVVASDQPLHTQDERDGMVLDNRLSPIHGPGGDVIQVAFFSRDITQIRRSDQRIRELVAYQQALLTSTPIGIAVFSLERRCIDANANFAAIFGLRIEDIKGESARVLYYDDQGYADVDRRAYPAVLEGGTFSGDVRMRRSDGAIIWVRLTGHMVDEKIPARGIIWAAEDISARKAMEDELKRSNAELEQFAYVTSHDLRQPLRMVTGFLGLVERRLQDKLDDDTREFIGFATDGAKRMDRLILDLLEYSRVGRRGAAPELVDLGDAMEEVTHYLGEAIREAGAVIEVRPGLPVVTGRRSELVRLLQNLVGNAVKYRDPGRTPRVTVSCRREAGFWRVAVEDNGIGIPADQAERVFGVFQRLHTAEEYEGTGIGLAVCKKIVEHHGGHIGVISQPGQGSQFHFTLPAPSGG